MFNFALEEKEAIDIIKVLGQLPTESGFFPIHQKLIAQFNEQAKQKAEQKEE